MLNSEIHAAALRMAEDLSKEVERLLRATRPDYSTEGLKVVSSYIDSMEVVFDADSDRRCEDYCVPIEWLDDFPSVVDDKIAVHNAKKADNALYEERRQAQLEDEKRLLYEQLKVKFG